MKQTLFYKYSKKFKVYRRVCYIPEDSKQIAICHNDWVYHCMEIKIMQNLQEAQSA